MKRTAGIALGLIGSVALIVLVFLGYLPLSIGRLGGIAPALGVAGAVVAMTGRPLGSVLLAFASVLTLVYFGFDFLAVVPAALMAVGAGWIFGDDAQPKPLEQSSARLVSDGPDAIAIDGSRHVAYVRAAMLPPAPAPVTQVGAARWLRENLFDGWVSPVLTVLSLIAIGWIVSEIAPWLSRSVWNAGSLRECRAIWAEAGVPEGACWGVINDRLNQLLYGFYPSHLYWRPNLALVLLFVALAPVLFTGVPRQLLWFSMAYPFLAYFLLWGGSVWVPVSAALGFVLGYVALRLLAPLGPILQTGGAVLAALAWWLLLAGPFAGNMAGILPLGNEFVRSDRFGGFLISLTIGLTAIALSLPLGILLALGRQSGMPLIKGVSVVFIEFIRGVPLITLLFTASLLLNYFLPPGTTFDLILRVIIMVTLFAAAYLAEVVRGGLAALPRGQYEAADSLGLDYWKAQRLIIMPQALKISIPGIVNTFIGLFKDTTLVVFIGLLDPIGLTNSIRASTDWQGIYWELFIFIGAVFFLMCFGMSRYSMYLERRLRTDHR